MHPSSRLNQPHLLSLTTDLFPSLFLGPAVCLNQMIAVGAIEQPGDPRLAHEGGDTDRLASTVKEVDELVGNRDDLGHR